MTAPLAPPPSFLPAQPDPSGPEPSIAERMVLEDAARAGTSVVKPAYVTLWERIQGRMQVPR